MFEQLLDELYKFTQIEEIRILTQNEKERYIEIVDTLQTNNIEIDFAIHI